jgi:hypothetical protein
MPPEMTSTPIEVTDEMVERACSTFWFGEPGRPNWIDEVVDEDEWRQSMREALTAAFLETESK